MPVRGDPRQRQLDEIALGEAGPADAFPLVRELLAEDAPKFAKRVHIALQDVVLRLVADRAPREEAAQWLDICGRASVMMRQGGAEVCGHHVAALAGLVERTERFFEAQPVDDLLGRRHVSKVLRLLAESDGPTSRAALLDATGLGQSNLSRLISMLEGHGLLRRDKSGRQADLCLTEAGKAVVAKLGDMRATVRPEIIWKARGVGICVSAPDGTVLSANPGFEDAVGTPAEVAAASASTGPGSIDVGTAEERWVRRVEIGEVEGGTASVWVDVSDLHLALAEAERRASAAEAKAAGLREALANSEAAAAAAERLLRRAQLSVEVVRERAVGRLSSMAKLVYDSLHERSRSARHAGDKPYQQLVAIKDALNNLLDPHVFSHRHYGRARENGRSLFEGLVKSTYALTDSKVDVEYPDWLRAEPADYRALIEPLTYFLLIGHGVVEMSISRDERHVVVEGVGHPVSGHAGPEPAHRSGAGHPLVAGFADTWAGWGVDVSITETSPHHPGVGFRMTVLREEPALKRRLPRRGPAVR